MRRVVLVRVMGPDAEGWGECGALCRPTYTSEYAAGALQMLRDYLVPLLLGASEVTADGDENGVSVLLAPVVGHRMAKAALEMAVLDAELRATGQSLAHWLGATCSAVVASATMGIPEGTTEVERLNALLSAVEELVTTGYRSVKLKITPGWDVTPTAAVRAHFPGLIVMADANGSYRAADDSEGEALMALDEQGLALLEQPLPADDLAGHARLARRLTTPIGLDESVESAATVVTLACLGAAVVVNLKAARVGGLIEARRVYDACVASDLAVRGGGMLETGVGRAAALVVAALPARSLPADLSGSARYWSRDLTTPFIVDGNGFLGVPVGPGLGVSVDSEAVERATVWRETYSYG